MKKSINKSVGINSSSRRGGVPKAAVRPSSRRRDRRAAEAAARACRCRSPETHTHTHSAGMITKDFTLPAEEDLTVQEINISTPSLRAAAFHVGKTCEAQNNVRAAGAP